MNGRMEINSGIESFIELAYTRREVPAWEVPLTAGSGPYGYYLHSRVPASHPFNPFGVTIGIDYRFKNTGLFTSYAQSHYRGVLGMRRSEEHTSELQSLMRISYAVFCYKKKNNNHIEHITVSK